MFTRRIFNHEEFSGEAYCKGYAFMWLVAEAAWKATDRVDRGQLSVSRRDLAVKWGWTEDRVRWVLKRWVDQKMIEIHVPNQAKNHTPMRTPDRTQMRMVITICNYSKYQGAGEPNTPTHTQIRARYKEEEIRNKKSKKEYMSGRSRPDDRFEEFWSLYPQRIGEDPKRKAQQRFAAAVEAGTDPAVIIEGARKHHGHELKGEARQFIPMATTWLHQRRWEIELHKPAAVDTETDEQIMARIAARSAAMRGAPQ